MAETDDSLFDPTGAPANGSAQYTEDDITTLDWKEHIRRRPGMYIGSLSTKGLNHLIYEIMDNKVLVINSPKVVYTLSDNKIYRNMEPVPLWEIRGNKICIPLSPKVVYEMEVQYEYLN